MQSPTLGTSISPERDPRAREVEFTEDAFVFRLDDGGGVHREALDEDLSVQGLLSPEETRYR